MPFGGLFDPECFLNFELTLSTGDFTVCKCWNRDWAMQWRMVHIRIWSKPITTSPWMALGHCAHYHTHVEKLGCVSGQQNIWWITSLKSQMHVALIVLEFLVYRRSHLFPLSYFLLQPLTVFSFSQTSWTLCTPDWTKLTSSWSAGDLRFQFPTWKMTYAPRWLSYCIEISGIWCLPRTHTNPKPFRNINNWLQKCIIWTQDKLFVKHQNSSMTCDLRPITDDSLKSCKASPVSNQLKMASI